MKNTITYRVPYADSDQMAVVYYANYFTYFERSRNELLRSIGLPYTLFEKNGYMLPVTQAHCDYKQPAKYDDFLKISAEIVEVTRATIKIVCRVLRDGVVLAEGFTIHACMSAKTRKIIRFPEFIKDKIKVD